MVLLSPLTKVEESFGMEACRDFQQFEWARVFNEFFSESGINITSVPEPKSQIDAYFYKPFLNKYLLETSNYAVAMKLWLINEKCESKGTDEIMRYERKIVASNSTQASHPVPLFSVDMNDKRFDIGDFRSFDHYWFPGPVPRSFSGSLMLAVLGNTISSAAVACHSNFVKPLFGAFFDDIIKSNNSKKYYHPNNFDDISLYIEPNWLCGKCSLDELDANGSRVDTFSLATEDRIKWVSNLSEQSRSTLKLSTRLDQDFSWLVEAGSLIEGLIKPRNLTAIITQKSRDYMRDKLCNKYLCNHLSVSRKSKKFSKSRDINAFYHHILGQDTNPSLKSRFQPQLSSTIEQLKLGINSLLMQNLLDSDCFNQEKSCLQEHALIALGTILWTRILLSAVFWICWFWVVDGLSAENTSSNQGSTFVCFLLLMSQFHTSFYSSRFLLNTFAMIVVIISWRFWMEDLRRIQNRKQIVLPVNSLVILSCCGILLRQEVGVLMLVCFVASIVALIPLWKNRHEKKEKAHSRKSKSKATRTITPNETTHIFKPNLALTITSLLVTLLLLLVDILMWSKRETEFTFRLPPELESFRYNILQGKNVEWGVQPWWWLFAHGGWLRLLMIGGCLLQLANFSSLGPILLKSTYMANLCSIVNYVVIIVYTSAVSLLVGHKEWRFIWYLIPLWTLNISKARWLVAVALAINFIQSAFMAWLSSMNYAYGWQGWFRLIWHKVDDAEFDWKRSFQEGLSGYLLEHITA